MRIDNVRAIAWDLDGTLLDSFHILEEILGELVIEHDLKQFTREHLLNNYHGSLEDTLVRALGLKSESELAPVVENFLEKQKAYYANNVDALLFADAVELVKQAASKGILQLIITNRAHRNRGSASPRYIVAASVLSHYINEVRSSDEVEYKKPDARSIIDWLRSHKIKGDQLLVIGDQFVDAQLANNLSARSILLKRVGRVGDHKLYADHQDESGIYVLSSLEDIQVNF